jgi:hypothetical protein
MARPKSNYKSMLQSDVPQSRNGKHRVVVGGIMDDLNQLEEGRALQVPLDTLGDTKENVRAALSREAKKRRLTVHTAADAKFLYVWAV